MCLYRVVLPVLYVRCPHPFLIMMEECGATLPQPLTSLGPERLQHRGNHPNPSSRLSLKYPQAKVPNNRLVLAVRPRSNSLRPLKQHLLLIFFSAVQGVGMAVYTLFDSVVSIAFPRKYVPLMVGVISTGNPIGTIIGFFGGSALLDALPCGKACSWWLPLPIIFGIGFFFFFKDSDSKKGM